MMMMNKALLQEFEKILKCQGIKQTTINRKLFQAGQFLQWLQLKGRELVDSRSLDITHYFGTKSFCREVQVQNLHAIKMLFDLCIEKEQIFENPALNIEIKRATVYRHYEVPTYEEIQAITRVIQKTDTLLALRDFTMIETCLWERCKGWGNYCIEC
jgi:site-specific recombinase XerD